MDAGDFALLFQASRGVQRPVFLEALRLARNDAGGPSALSVLREDLVYEINRLWSLSGSDKKVSKDTVKLVRGLKDRIAEEDLATAWSRAEREHSVAKVDVQNALDSVSTIAARHIDEGTWPQLIPADARKGIRAAIEPAYEKLTGTPLGGSRNATGRSADAPWHFDKMKFRARHIEQVPVPGRPDPRFYRYWVGDSRPAVDVEGICDQWEGGDARSSDGGGG